MPVYKKRGRQIYKYLSNLLYYRYYVDFNLLFICYSNETSPDFYVLTDM